MSSPYDLISLDQAKVWGVGGDDAFTQALITQASRQILTWLRRPNILPAAYTDEIDGWGLPRLQLKNWPVTSVESVIIDNVAIPPSAPPTSTAVTPTYPSFGYYLQPWDGYPPGAPQRIDIYRWFVPRGCTNIAISYKAGYQIVNEDGVVPAGAARYSPAQPFGAWASDGGVTYADGTALVAVSGAPAQGQYQVAGGSYEFNAADANAAIRVSYGYVPSDIAYAASLWVAEMMTYQGRIGLRSKSLGGQETISFNLPGFGGNAANAIPPYVQQSLWPYRRVIQT